MNELSVVPDSTGSANKGKHTRAFHVSNVCMRVSMYIENECVYDSELNECASW